MNFLFIKDEKTIFNIDNNQKCFLSSNQHIRMISEGSCDTEDWSNDGENSALITEINYIYSDRKQLFEIVILFHKITVFTVFMIK